MKYAKRKALYPVNFLYPWVLATPKNEQPSGGEKLEEYFTTEHTKSTEKVIYKDQETSLKRHFAMPLSASELCC